MFYKHTKQMWLCIFVHCLICCIYCWHFEPCHCNEFDKNLYFEVWLRLWTQSSKPANMSQDGKKINPRWVSFVCLFRIRGYISMIAITNAVTLKHPPTVEHEYTITLATKAILRHWFSSSHSWTYCLLKMYQFSLLHLRFKY